MMTDNFKNLVIDITKDESGRPVKIVLPISGNTLEIEYNANGGVSNVTGVDMTAVIGAVGVDASVYADEDEPIVDGVASPVIQMGAKVVSQSGSIITLDFDEKGRLREESNEKFTSHYFLKEASNYGPKCTQRLATVYGNSAVIIRELKNTETGEISYEESVFANVLAVSANL